MTPSAASAQQPRLVQNDRTASVDLPHRVVGESLPVLRRELLAAVRHHDRVTVDCRQVQGLSPAGQALLVAVWRTARRHHCRLHLTQPTPGMIAALRSTGLSHLLNPPLSTSGASQNRRPRPQPSP